LTPLATSQRSRMFLGISAEQRQLANRLFRPPRPLLGPGLRPRHLPDKELLFVAPGPIVLRSAQPLRLISAVGCRNGAVGQGQPALCRLVVRPLLRWPDRQQTALPFDHDIAGIRRRSGRCHASGGIGRPSSLFIGKRIQHRLRHVASTPPLSASGSSPSRPSVFSSASPFSCSRSLRRN
jgi:hypothetical protein